MYEIVFYEEQIGCSDITAYIKELQAKSKKSKNYRIQFNKIVAYFDLLEEMGTRMGEPFTKHLEGDIWELRPLKHRFLYACFEHNKFIVLHHFVKRTKKLPKRELEHAKRKLLSYKERNENHDHMENIETRTKFNI